MVRLVDKLKTAAVLGSVYLGLIASVPATKGAVRIESFDELIPKVSGITREYVRMEYDENLMIRDPNSIEDMVAGIDKSIWRIGFIKYTPDGMYIGGFANNDNYLSKTYSGYEGWCDGFVYDSVFPQNSKADDVVIAHDPDGGQMATYYSDGTLLFDENINLYFTEDIEFNGSQGDLSQLPNFIILDAPILPHTVVNPISYNLREGPFDTEDLADVAYYWLSDCQDNHNCQGLDFDNNGTVNGKDLAYIANQWQPAP